MIQYAFQERPLSNPFSEKTYREACDELIQTVKPEDVKMFRQGILIALSHEESVELANLQVTP